MAKCDAIEAEAGTEVLCAYNRTVGTRWTDETRGHMNVSSKVQAAIQVNGHDMTFFYEIMMINMPFGIIRKLAAVPLVKQEVGLEARGLEN